MLARAGCEGVVVVVMAYPIVSASTDIVHALYGCLSALQNVSFFTVG